jgi:enoyl-CoA hydratase/carnithine racemase
MASVPPANGKMIAEADGAIGWLIFNNPARRNAVSMEMWRAVPGILDRFEADPAIRVIVLRGAGDKAFVSGLDISEFADAFSSSATAVGIEEMSARACARVENSPKPTIAMINGFCMGAGIQIASSCDLRVAADTAVAAPVRR